MPKPSDHAGLIPNKADRLSGLAITSTHPDDVLHSDSLSVAEKSAILAAWASDAHAVPDHPSMRQLDSGAIIGVDAILAGLRALDASETAKRVNNAERGPKTRRTLISRMRWFPRGRDHDNDDDPPPCPTSALPPLVELELRRRRDKAWGLVAA